MNPATDRHPHHILSCRHAESDGPEITLFSGLHFIQLVLQPRFFYIL